MKKKYDLQGMSCGSCVTSIKKVLYELPGIEDAEVHLHSQSAVLTMSESIDVDELQAQLNKAGHYTIKEIVSENSTT